MPGTYLLNYAAEIESFMKMGCRIKSTLIHPHHTLKFDLYF